MNVNSLGKTSGKDEEYSWNQKSSSFGDADPEPSPIDAKFAKKVVNELYERYNTLRERRSAYKDLLVFLFFVTFNLSILYLQRDATSAYSVVSTITSSDLIPKDAETTSGETILDWLNDVLSSIWQDPVCGDDTCEEPFEFAYYGRFGCKADCGMYTDKQNITSIQIDLYFDFHHASGSTPATTLMQDSSWNLCPDADSSFYEVFHMRNTSQIKHGTACYWEEDNTFSDLSGHLRELVDDVPDGEWHIMLRGDQFFKVGGAVRDRSMVEIYAVEFKYTAAYAIVVYELGSELKYLNATWQDMTTTNEEIILNELDELYIEQTAAIDDEYSSYPTNYSNYTNDLYTLNYIYNGSVEAAVSVSVAYCEELKDLNITVGTMTTETIEPEYGETITNVYGDKIYCGKCFSDWPIPSGYGSDNNDLFLWQTSNDTVGENRSMCLCNDTVNEYCTWTESVILEHQDEIRTNLTYLDQYVLDAGNELYDGIMDEYWLYHRALHYEIDNAIGTDINNELEVSTTTIVDDKTGAEYEASAYKAGLSQTAVVSNNWTRLMYDVQGRISELDHRESTQYDWNTSSVTETASNSVSLTYALSTEEIVDLIKGSFINTTAYTYVNNDEEEVAWEPLNVGASDTSYTEGNTEMYMTCDLTNRGPKWVGTCVGMDTILALAQDDYVVTSDDETLNNVTQSHKAEECTVLCYCEGETTTGPSGQQGLCTTTPDMSSQEISDAIANAGDDATVCACVDCGVEEEDISDLLDHTLYSNRRRLLNSTEEMYDALMADIQHLSDQQTDLSAQVTEVQNEQAVQKEAADAHHDDTTLEDTITAGFNDLQASYEILQEQMDELLEKTDAALEQSQQTQEQAQRANEQIQQQTDSINAINSAVEKQLAEITKAYSKNQISSTQRMDYYWKAALDQAKETKKATLANEPCSTAPVQHHFQLNNYNESQSSAARERLVGINNRVVAGMLLYATRYIMGKCDTNFDNLVVECRVREDPGDTGYGVDPVFKMDTSLYLADLNSDYPESDDKSAAAKDSQIASYYNCSELVNPTYNDANATNVTGNQAGTIFCKELFNQNDIPWGFHRFDLYKNGASSDGGYTHGYPVFFDINLSQDRANDYFLYVQDGQYIQDAETDSVRAHLITYNAELRIFANIKVSFDFLKAGKIEISHSIQAVRVELYVDQQDYIRCAMEICLCIGSVVALVVELSELHTSRMKYGTVQAYFRSAWNYIDLTSIGIQITCMMFWGIYVLTLALEFDTSDAPGGRYEVYANLDAKARYLRLAGNCGPDGDRNAKWYNDETCEESGSDLNRGAALVSLSEDLAEMDMLGTTLSFYMTLSGINIILMIARSLKLMDFQPRLGIVTKTLALAASDILHFMVVFGVVFMGYVMMGTLVFGYKIVYFSSLTNSLRTCFETLLGEIGWNNQLQEPYLKSVELWAGRFYFGSYQILVFMILLNFLLAIIVDAYAEIKEAAHETVSVPAEVYPMLKEKWRTLLKSKYFYRKHIPEDRIRKSLKVLAGRGDEESDSEESIDYDFDAEKFLKYAAGKADEEYIDRHTLTKVLSHCIAHTEEKHEARQTEVAAAPVDSTAWYNSLLPNMFRRKQAQVRPPTFKSSDVDNVADMLINQHGEPKPKDAEGDEDDDEDLDTKMMMDKMAELIRGQENLMTGQKKLENLEERLLQAIDLPAGAEGIMPDAET